MEENRKKLSSDKAESDTQKADLDSLMLDAEDNADSNSTTEETVNFEVFMSEYRNLMGQNSENDPQVNKEKNEDPQEEFLISLPKKEKQTKQKQEYAPIKKDTEWDEDITLAPEEYEELDDGKDVKDEVTDEPVPDFDLGEKSEENDDKFQISINFAGEQKTPSADEGEKESKYDPDKPRAIDWVFDIAEMFVFVLATVIVLTSFVFKHSVVEGDSMLNTLEDGDHLIISDMFYTPDYGDIIVFEDYSISSDNLKKPIVKRVIGLPGDTVEVTKDENGYFQVRVNGKPLEEEYAFNDPLRLNGSAELVGVWTVPDGEVFVMGDNRYNSTDSRDSRVGTVDIDSILGKVILRFLPFDKFGTVN